LESLQQQQHQQQQWRLCHCTTTSSSNVVSSSVFSSSSGAYGPHPVVGSTSTAKEQGRNPIESLTPLPTSRALHVGELTCRGHSAVSPVRPSSPL
jgi:hypothetical protein